MILSNNNKALIRLLGCAGWPVPLLTAMPDDSFFNIIAINQRVVVAKGGQRLKLVAVMIKVPVLFYSVAALMPDLHPVAEFRYLYGVDLIEVKPLFYR